jgi:hypothetical protein
MHRFGSFASSAAKNAGSYAAPAMHLASHVLGRAGLHGASAMVGKAAGGVARGADAVRGVADAFKGLGGAIQATGRRN